MPSVRGATGSDAGGFGLYDRNPRTPATAGDPVPGMGVPMYGVRPPGARAPSRSGPGSIRRDGPSPGATGDGGGACVARWRGDPGTQGPRGRGRLDGGAADAG